MGLWEGLRHKAWDGWGETKTNIKRNKEPLAALYDCTLPGGSGVIEHDWEVGLCAIH